MRISFNRPPFVGKETEYIKEAVEKNGMICGDGPFTKKCSEWMKDRFQTKNVLLTTSCTHALEMAAFLADIQPGDEVIMPSYTFVSTADAFVLRGATCVFVDIRPDTMNIDETKIEEAITEKTKAIVPVHYAGVSCAMDEIMAIAKKYNLKVVEDAAQGVNAFYKGKALGTIGDFGCYSFHETKNYSMGEGGAILFQDDKYLEPAEILREKGTNRSQYFRGQIDKYTWVGYGSSYLPSDMNAAYLWAQLEVADKINDKRLSIWNFYHEELKELEDRGVAGTPVYPGIRNTQCPHVLHQSKRSEGADKTSGISETARDPERLSLCTASHGNCRKEIWKIPRRGCLHDKRERTAVPSAMYYSLSLEEAAEVVKALKEFTEYETIEGR